MPIPEIRTDNIDIGDVFIRDMPKWLTSDPPQALPVYPPVTDIVGTPIINMPGCVTSHRDSSENVNLKEEDDKGSVTICDAGTPSFNPLTYDPNNLDLKQDPPPPPPVKPTEKPKDVKPPVAPPPPKPPSPKTDCPTREQQLKNPVGKLIEGDKKIVAYEMVGKQCLPVTETLSIPDQIILNIPNAGAVTTTASIAVVATSSALLAKPLADLLLKVVKPVVKKVLKKVAALRGKKIPRQSSGERIAEQRQRNHAVKALRSVRPLKK